MRWADSRVEWIAEPPFDPRIENGRVGIVVVSNKEFRCVKRVSAGFHWDVEATADE